MNLRLLSGNESAAVHISRVRRIQVRNEEPAVPDLDHGVVPADSGIVRNAVIRAALLPSDPERTSGDLDQLPC